MIKIIQIPERHTTHGTAEQHFRRI